MSTHLFNELRFLAPKSISFMMLRSQVSQKNGLFFGRSLALPSRWQATCDHSPHSSHWHHSGRHRTQSQGVILESWNGRYDWLEIRVTIGMMRFSTYCFNTSFGPAMEILGSLGLKATAWHGNTSLFFFFWWGYPIFASMINRKYIFE